MNNIHRSIYNHLPATFKNLAASLYGYKLLKWRYGPETEKLVLEAFERERWSHEKWEKWKEERLAYMLEYSAANVPYYREYWSNRRQKGDNSSPGELKNWPILTKETLRKNQKVFIADGFYEKNLYRDHTSGTTGTPVDFFSSREILRKWYALFEARWRRWYGVSLKDNWAIIGGQYVVPLNKDKPPFWVWNRAFHQLYLSAFHMRPELMKYYLKAMQDHNIVHMYSYSESVHQLAQAALKENIKIKLKVVVTDAEPLFEHQRETISEAFDCPVRETFGQAEMLCAASECEHGKLHLWSDAGHVELLDESDQPVENGTAGRIIGTSLLNETMPLIRYDLMDMAQFPLKQEQCKCRRTLPVVEKFTGRMDDIIYAKDGRRLVQLDIILGSHLKIREVQIIQETLDDFTVKVVPDEGWNESAKKTLVDSLKELAGDVNVNVVEVEEIPRTWAGKFRIIVSKVNQKDPEKVN
ncbi:MAG: phenylacetate--CoA ligase family protein [Ignavibacteria bacterium]|nr:phenylacetate--CoA ligase family protein [Ignavibacteria bacterium]